MPHMIENNMIAWKGQMPWHGLGYEVSENATGAEMLQVAKLNWTVQRRALAMRPGTGDTSVMQTEPLKNFRAIVRADTDTVFQVATDRYQPVQNAEIVEFFREYCEAGHARMETVGGLRGGAVVWALARLNGGSTANLGGVDELRGYMLLATSHDGSVSTIGKPTQTRVVCWNTLSAAIGEDSKAEFRMKHTRKWSQAVADEARKVMGMAIRQVQKTNELAEQLSRVRIDERGRLEFVSQLIKADGKLLDVVAEQSSKSLLDTIVDNHSLATASPEKVKAEESKVGRAILDAILDSPRRRPRNRTRDALGSRERSDLLRGPSARTVAGFPSSERLVRYWRFAQKRCCARCVRHGWAFHLPGCLSRNLGEPDALPDGLSELLARH